MGSEFDKIRALAHKEFGLDLRAGKEQLVSARLGKHVRKFGYHTFRDYLTHVQSDATGAALMDMIDALTTNFTSFMREPAHFEFLRKTVLPEFEYQQPVQIWSAACATGEEPYSIALSVLEEFGERALRERPHPGNRYLDAGARERRGRASTSPTGWRASRTRLCASTSCAASSAGKGGSASIPSCARCSSSGT